MANPWNDHESGHGLTTVVWVRSPDDLDQPLGIGILGPLTASRGPVRLPLGGRQQRAVLAQLVTWSGSVLTVDRLADNIWGDEVPPGYVQTIHTYVSHLRGILGPDRGWLSTVNGGYRLDLPADTVDAERFRRRVKEGLALRQRGRQPEAGQALEEALALWTGDVLEDLAGLPFVQGVAGPLEELRLTATEAWLGIRLDIGEHEACVADLEGLVAAHPLREQLHAFRMLALYRSGRQADALAAYQRARRVLDEELGVAPGSHLRRMHERILAQDPSLELAPAAAPSSAPDRATLVPVVAAPAGPGPGRGDADPGRRGRRLMAGVLAGAVAVSAGIAAFGVVHWRTETLTALPSNGVARIDAAGSVRDPVPLGPSPSGLASGAGSLWGLASGEGRLYRIDPRDHRVVQTIPVGRSPSAVAVSGHDVWVANTDDGTVSRVNSDADRVVETIGVGVLPTAIAAGPSGVWVTNRGDNTVQRIDPRSGVAGPPITVGGLPSAVAVVDGTVYVANAQDRSVLRLDPSTGEQLGGPIVVGAGPRALAVTADGLWVANADEQSVSRVDRGSGREIARIPVGDGPGSIALHEGKVWVGSEYDGTVSVIDPGRNVVEHRYAVGAAPRAVAVADSHLWVLSGPRSAGAHLGGTLRVSGVALPGQQPFGIDPSTYPASATTYQTLRLLYDGLVAFRYTGGPDGFSLVPDLATAVPLPTDGGRTYAFTLRSGIRFSDGSAVRASDIRRGVHRALTIQPGLAGSSRIVGATECVEEPGSCDLSRGVIVDDSTGSVVFHLTEPNSDFLFQLAYFGLATADSAPAEATTAPLPGTGPYVIDAYSSDGITRLRRNPYFRQWSYAAQPAGYPDVIEFTRAPNQAAAAQAIEEGRADVARLGVGLGAEATADLARRFPSRVLPTATPSVSHFLLNTTVPPFDDVRVRRALNYAVDRRAIVRIAGGDVAAAATCQLLPANVPGSKPYCPYSSDPARGSEAGPDLARARALVAASGTKGQRVSVRGFSVEPSHSLTQYVAGVLEDLGYQVTREPDWTGGLPFYDLIADPKPSWQVLDSPGWFADWGAASNFYFNLFSCHEYTGTKGDRLYCNPSLDTMADRARSLEVTDPTESRRLWAEVDRRLTDDAPAVFTYAERRLAFVSTRVGNVQSDPVGNPLLSQLWVR